MATYYLDLVNGNDANTGADWANAWKTFNNGATSARIAAGDTIRVAKTADPTSIGNATWTSKSATVTLASAKTTSLYLDGAWTAANSATATTNTSAYKQGSNSSQVTTPASTATATKYAYYATGTLDLSSYDAITFWFRNNTTAVADANRYVVKLCSDTTGDTSVDEFAIPAIAGTAQWVPLTLTRTGGGALGSSIKSIALYTGSSSPGNTQVTLIDNVSACTASSLSLTSLISKNGDGFSLTETWHGLQSIDGTTVVLANRNLTNAGSSDLMGYYTAGTTPETVTTYVRPTFKLAIQSSFSAYAQALTKAGTAGNLITYSGGWNTSSNTQDGITWLDGQNGNGAGFGGRNYIRIERFGLCRFFKSLQATSTGSEFNNIFIINCERASDVTGSKLTNIISNNCSGIRSDSYSYIENIKLYSYDSADLRNFLQSKVKSVYVYNFSNTNGGSFDLTASDVDYLEFNDNTAILSGTVSRIREAVIKNNANGPFVGYANVVIGKLTSSGNGNTATTMNLIVKQTTSSPQLIGLPDVSYPYYTQIPSTMYSLVGGDANDHRAYWAYGNAISQTTTRHTASGIAWQINVTDTKQTSDLPALYPIAKVAVNASSLVTVKAWVKLSHATNIGAKLAVLANELPGISADVTTTKAADTNWEELTITFTPTVKGVVQVYLQAYWLASTANQSVYVDDITVTQA